MPTFPHISAVNLVNLLLQASPTSEITRTDIYAAAFDAARTAEIVHLVSRYLAFIISSYYHLRSTKAFLQLSGNIAWTIRSPPPPPSLLAYNSLSSVGRKWLDRFHRPQVLTSKYLDAFATLYFMKLLRSTTTSHLLLSSRSAISVSLAPYI